MITKTRTQTMMSNEATATAAASSCVFNWWFYGYYFSQESGRL
ncbi:hypothetical protein [Thalassolituus sp. UBA6592]|nr:hypothetical protein [Thalassolituus sp. UBA6592]